MRAEGGSAPFRNLGEAGADSSAEVPDSLAFGSASRITGLS